MPESERKYSYVLASFLSVDEKWEQLLDQMSFDDMKNLVNVGGWQTVEVQPGGKKNEAALNWSLLGYNVLKNSKDKQQLEEKILKDERYKSLGKKEAEVLNVCVDADIIIEGAGLLKEIDENAQSTVWYSGVFS